MSNTSKEAEALGDSRNNSPVMQPESPGNPLSARLQEEYSELLRYAVGMPGPDRRTLESSGQAFQPISKSGASSTRQTPIDQQHEWESPLTIQGNDGTGNFNSNSLYNSQQTRFRSVTTTRTMNVNVNKDEQKDDSDNHESTSTLTSGVVTSPHATIIEPTLICLGGKLDSWLGKLKCDILAEFRLLTLQALESQKCYHQIEIQGIKSEKQYLEKEVNRLTEMVNTCEQSMSRKDTVIDNVTQALRKQRDKVSLAQSFYHAKAEHADAKRERFTESLAVKYNKNQLVEKVLRAWYGLIQKNWKSRHEKVYDNKAQDVCRQLCLDYEDKIKALNEEIENVNRKLRGMQNEREQYALQVKKAFMRGMCALNMETMSAFTQEEPQISPLSATSEPDDNSNACNIKKNLQSNCPQKDDLLLKTVPADVAASAMPDLDSHFSSLAVVGTSHPEQSKFRPSKGKSRPSTAPSISSSHQAKTWGVSQSLAPPMASVIVERHDPVTKQTVGKATASRYPKHSTSKGSHFRHKQALHSSMPGPVSQVFQTFQPLAGQTANMTTGIKVVDVARHEHYAGSQRRMVNQHINGVVSRYTMRDLLKISEHLRTMFDVQ